MADDPESDKGLRNVFYDVQSPVQPLSLKVVWEKLYDLHYYTTEVEP